MQKLKILWNKLSSKIVSKFINMFATQSNYDLDRTVLLIGSARSGTTFLMESLNSKNEYRIIFEPFNPTYTKEWKTYSARHYIDPKSQHVQEKQVLENILRGKIKNPWVDQYNKKLKSDQRLIKSVRANFMLDYIERSYPEIQIVYTYRNPYKVVASRINLNFDPKDIFLVLEHEAFLATYYSDIDLAELNALLTSTESRHAALWCFENRFILNSIDERNLIVVPYEEMIGKTVNLSDDGVVISNAVRKPSVTSSTQSPYNLSEKEQQNISKILQLFGIEEFELGG